MIPPHWEHDHVYVWPSQWQQDGHVYLTPKHDPGPTHYMQDQSVVTTRCDVDIFVVDANNSNKQLSFDSVHNKHVHAQQIRGMGNWASIIQKCCKKQAKNKQNKQTVLPARAVYGMLTTTTTTKKNNFFLLLVFPSDPGVGADMVYIRLDIILLSKS